MSAQPGILQNDVPERTRPARRVILHVRRAGGSNLEHRLRSRAARRLLGLVGRLLQHASNPGDPQTAVIRVPLNCVAHAKDGAAIQQVVNVSGEDDSLPDLEIEHT